MGRRRIRIFWVASDKQMSSGLRVASQKVPSSKIKMLTLKENILKGHFIYIYIPTVNFSGGLWQNPEKSREEKFAGNLKRKVWERKGLGMHQDV